MLVTAVAQPAKSQLAVVKAAAVALDAQVSMELTGNYQVALRMMRMGGTGECVQSRASELSVHNHPCHQDCFCRNMQAV